MGVTLLAVLLGLFLLLVGVLAVPVEVEVRRPGGGADISLRLSWLSGRLLWEPTGPGRGGDESPPGAEEAEAPERAKSEPGPGEPEEGEEETSRGPSLRGALAAARTPGLVPAARRLVSRASGAVRLREAEATVRLADPAATGRLWGAWAALRGLAGPAGLRLRLRPDFGPGPADLAGRLRARVTPLRLVGAAAGFLLTPAVVRAGWRAFRAG